MRTRLTGLLGGLAVVVATTAGCTGAPDPARAGGTVARATPAPSVAAASSAVSPTTDPGVLLDGARSALTQSRHGSYSQRLLEGSHTILESSGYYDVAHGWSSMHVSLPVTDDGATYESGDVVRRGRTSRFRVDDRCWPRTGELDELLSRTRQGRTVADLLTFAAYSPLDLLEDVEPTGYLPVNFVLTGRLPLARTLRCSATGIARCWPTAPPRSARSRSRWASPTGTSTR